MKVNMCFSFSSQLDLTIFNLKSLA